jgi:hypothetical protein
MQPVRPFTNRDVQIDSSSDKDITDVVTANNEFFYKHFIETSSDEDSDNDTYVW